MEAFCSAADSHSWPEVKKPSFFTQGMELSQAALFFHTINGFGYAPWPVVRKRRRTCNACLECDPKTDSCCSCGCSLHGTIIGRLTMAYLRSVPEGKW